MSHCISGLTFSYTAVLGSIQWHSLFRVAIGIRPDAISLCAFHGILDDSRLVIQVRSSALAFFVDVWCTAVEMMSPCGKAKCG